MKIGDYIYTGFYLQPNYEEALGNFVNPKYDEICEKIDDFNISDASIFLMGICHVFAYFLNSEFKYDMYELYDGKKIVHWFCMSKCDDTDLYIDVRGITSDEKVFANYFHLKDATNRKKIDKINEDKDFNDYSKEFAKYIIEQNWENYIDKIAKYME